MKKLFELTDSEKQRILEMHINATKKNYLKEQHEPPKLYPGEFLTPSGDILKKEISEVPPLSVKMDTNFKPGNYTDFDLSKEPKMSAVLEWLNSPDILDRKVTIVITAGSSQSGSGTEEQRRQFNIDLAGKRAQTAISGVKSFLQGKIPQEVYDSINYVVDISQAHKGPSFDPEKNNSEEKQYQEFQFVTVTCMATGKKEVMKKRTPKYQPYDFYQIQGMPHTAVVTFCASGFAQRENGTYQCKDNRYTAMYYTNNYDGNPSKPKTKMRWIPMEPDRYEFTNSDFERKTGIWEGRDATWCFSNENYNAVKSRPICAEFYKKWDNEYPRYSQKYREAGMGDFKTPGPEVGEGKYEKIKKGWSNTEFLAEN